MRINILLIILLIVSGCATTTSDEVPTKEYASYSTGGDGSSFKQAVFFPSAKSSIEGIPLEGRWIAENYPGAKKHNQAVVNNEGRLFDRITIKTASGEEKFIYFDMTSWYGFPGLKE